MCGKVQSDLQRVVSPNLWVRMSVHNRFLMKLSLVLPAVDHSRVKLENTENDYINASLVVMEEAQRSYILTQVIQGFSSSINSHIYPLVILWVNWFIGLPIKYHKTIFSKRLFVQPLPAWSTYVFHFSSKLPKQAIPQNYSEFFSNYQ